MRIRDVIAYSSNIGMAKIILRRYESQPGMFHHRLREMGFFDPLNIGISGETVPVVDSVGNKNWDRVKLSRMAYGYSTLIPPICTLAMYNAIANGGRYVRPRLVQRFMREGEPDSIVPLTYIRDQVCTPGNARKLAEMLRNVVEYGTGKSLRNDQVAIAGKTGTCYVTEVGRGYSSKKRLSFCGFFPYENPKYSCIVVMEGANCGAARSSGTVLKNVALKLYSLGMLNNISDFHASEQKSTTRPTFFATAADRSNNSKLVANAGIKELKRFRSPRNVTDGEVPEVIGLGAREAISRLEAAGLKVKLHGYGYVARQSVRAGTKAEKGTLVELTLRE